MKEYPVTVTSVRIVFAKVRFFFYFSKINTEGKIAVFY